MVRGSMMFLKSIINAKVHLVSGLVIGCGVAMLCTKVRKRAISKRTDTSPMKPESQF